VEHSSVEEEAVAFRRCLLNQIVCPSQKVLYTNVNAAFKKNLCLGEGIKVSRYLGGDISLSFSEAGSPPMPQCVLGIS